MTSVGPILFSLLLLLCIEHPANREQAKTQDSNSPSATAQVKTREPTGERIIVVTLPKTADVKRLKAGDTLTAVATEDTPTAVATGVPISPRVTFVGRVLEVHALGSENKDSLLLVRFEKPRVGNNQEAPVNLGLQAVVAPAAWKWSISPIIVDRYPCDYEAHPKGCEENADKQDPTSQPGFTGLMRLVCERNRTRGKAQTGNNCVPVSEARGVYGFPGLSIASSPNGSERDIAFTSISKNVHLERGTVLIFSVLDSEMDQKTQP
jgi:hypothetical protein